MGGVILWTSINGIRNIKSNKQFYAYSEKDEINCIQISVPFEAIYVTDKCVDKLGIEVRCHEKSKW